MLHGKESFLKPVEAQVLLFVFVSRKQGAVVIVPFIVKKLEEALLALKNSF